MSVVATYVTDETIYLGADSLVSYGDVKITNHSAKLFYVKASWGADIHVGWTGSAEHAKLFKYYLAKTESDVNITNDEFFIMSMYKGFSDFTKSIDVELVDMHGDDFDAFHIVLEGKAYSVTGYYVREITTFDVIGNGAAAARAAMVLGHSLTESLAVACETNLYCDYPIYVHSVSCTDNSWSELHYPRQLFAEIKRA